MILFSSPIVGEQPSSTQVVAACLIILGEVVVAVFGDHTNDDGVTVNDVVRDAYTFVFFSDLLLSPYTSVVG